MNVRKLILAAALCPILLGAMPGCSDSTSDTRADANRTGTAATQAPSVSRSATGTAATDGSMSRDHAVTEPANAAGDGAWPADLELPAGMQIVGTAATTGSHTSMLLSCAGAATKAITSLTTMLNTAGYRTKWELGSTNGNNEPVTVEGRKSGRIVRATIHANHDGTCERVAVSYVD